MNDSQLDYFVLLYNTRSIQKAAAAAPMTTQGISKAIRALEAELGVTLFERQGSGARKPTPYADALMEYAGFVTSERERLSRRFDQITAERQRVVRLVTALGLSGLVGNRCVEAFARKHPDITVTTGETDDLSCDRLVRTGECDLGFTLAPFDEGLQTVPLARGRVFFWINVKHPLAQRDALTPADLDGQSLMTFGNPIKIDGRISALMATAGAKPAAVVTSPEMFWHYQFAAEGSGLGLTVEHALDIPLYTNNPQVVAVPLEGLSWTYGLSYARGRALPEHVQEFFDFAVAFARNVR